MVEQKEEHQFLWFGLSIAIHTLILACLFASLINTPSLIQHPKKKLFAFKPPVPVVFYGHQMAPNKRPGSVRTPQSHPSKEKQKIVEKQSKEEKAIKEELKKDPVKNAMRKKQPTLADIFNHARKTFATSQPQTNLEVPGDGAGQELVIRQGDIKYYSLWSTFLQHINNAVSFDVVKRSIPLRQWVMEKRISQNLLFQVTINKKGETQDVTIIRSSGYAPLDEFYVGIAWSASSFPPLPNHLEKDLTTFEIQTMF